MEINLGQGRKDQLLTKLGETKQRYQRVYNKELGDKQCLEWIERLIEDDKLQFFKDRFGFLNEADATYLREHLKESKPAKKPLNSKDV